MTYTTPDDDEGDLGVGFVPAPGTMFTSVTLTADDMFAFGFADWFNENIAPRMVRSPRKEH